MLPSNLQVLRDKKSDWSLADDRQLCGVLEEIRSSITLKINNVSDAVQENSLKIANACVQASNLNNRLSLFSADQFIENRVGDEASTCGDPALTFQTDENLTRPLPFLIGCPEWNSSSYAGSLEECAKTAKVTEEIIISLPSFTQPKMTECKWLTYSDAIDGNLTCTMSNRSTSNAEDVESKADNYSNEYRNETYQHVVTASSSQASLTEETGVENTVFDLSRNVTSRQYSEGSVTLRSPRASVGHQDSKVLSHKPPDLEVSARLPTMKDQTKRKTNEGVSNAVRKLFVDSSSDEDDLFSDLKNAENSTDCVFVNNAKPSNVFRNKLNRIFTNKIMPNAINGVEKCQGIQEKEVAEESMKNDRTSAVLPSIAKQRAKGPQRRVPSRLLQHSNKDHNEEVMRSVRAKDASTEDSRNIGEKAEVCEERQDDQLKIDSGKYITENINSVKQKSDINSIFSSDSDDDIFSTFSGKSKTNAFVSKSNVRNNDVQSLLFSRGHSNMSASRIQALKSDFKNLFDSDDEDIFGSTISVKKHEQKPAKDKEAFLEKIIQEVITKKDGSVLEKKETVVPRKLSTRPKRVDIFGGDDSDSDVFS
ncbi:Uncharacterized protein BM_BM12422 [Brugia malayi]|uniref:Uncharacterized protein n=1 Tax=Brugia malayi TaxID=6279 RepID=A0A4E9EW52_BRUMA|nr:Uncharacterized protein BM_BM12422 [Brugia malayi]VIO87640.1 Uncharacterized protein BM_BM12422 [Brugia malayi]